MCVCDILWLSTLNKPTEQTNFSQVSQYSSLCNFRPHPSRYIHWCPFSSSECPLQQPQKNTSPGILEGVSTMALIFPFQLYQMLFSNNTKRNAFMGRETVVCKIYTAAELIPPQEYNNHFTKHPPRNWRYWGQHTYQEKKHLWAQATSEVRRNEAGCGKKQKKKKKKNKHDSDGDDDNDNNDADDDDDDDDDDDGDDDDDDDDDVVDDVDDDCWQRILVGVLSLKRFLGYEISGEFESRDKSGNHWIHSWSLRERYLLKQTLLPATCGWPVIYSMSNNH